FSVAYKTQSYWWTPRFEVHINNTLPTNSNPLKLRCKSADDDLGDRVLYTNQEMEFHFNEHFLGGTLYFCHFYWDSKNTSHDIFNDKIADKCGLESIDAIGTLKVQEDGFYFNSQELPRPNAQYEKLYEWWQK
ncbi:hypothetical protein MTR67_045337, partial [Solanum verrucosum]